MFQYRGVTVDGRAIGNDALPTYNPPPRNPVSHIVL